MLSSHTRALYCVHTLCCNAGMTVLGGSPDTQMMASLTQMFKNQTSAGRRSDSKKLTIRDARPQMIEAELEKVTACSVTVK
jgi:ATP-dependent protease HslVU (ClpYQ) ATPase subunit